MLGREMLGHERSRSRHIQWCDRHEPNVILSGEKRSYVRRRPKSEHQRKSMTATPRRINEDFQGRSIERVRVIDGQEQLAFREDRLHQIEGGAPQGRESKRRVSAVFGNRVPPGIPLGDTGQTRIGVRRAADRAWKTQERREQIEQSRERTFTARSTRAVLDTPRTTQGRDAHPLIQQSRLADSGFAAERIDPHRRATGNPRVEFADGLGAAKKGRVPAGARRLTRQRNDSTSQGHVRPCELFLILTFTRTRIDTVAVENAQCLGAASSHGERLGERERRISVQRVDLEARTRECCDALLLTPGP
jgi:hypothetical protein